MDEYAKALCCTRQSFRQSVPTLCKIACVTNKQPCRMAKKATNLSAKFLFICRDLVLLWSIHVHENVPSLKTWRDHLFINSSTKMIDIYHDFHFFPQIRLKILEQNSLQSIQYGIMIHIFSNDNFITWTEYRNIVICIMEENVEKIDDACMTLDY